MTKIKIVKRPSIFCIKIIIVGILITIGICYPSFREYFNYTKNKITELKTEKKELKAQLKVANSSNDSLEMENNAHKDFITNLQNKLERDSTTYCAKIEKLNVEKTELENDKKDLQNELKEKRSEIAGLRNQPPKIVTKEKEVIKYRDNPEQAKQEKKIKEQTDKIKKLEEDLEIARNTIRNLNAKKQN